MYSILGSLHAKVFRQTFFITEFFCPQLQIYGLIFDLRFSYRWFLVETNYDHWTTPPPGDDRRDPAIKALNKLGQGGVNPSSLFQVLSIHPTLNNKTVYTTIMAAGKPDLFNTWIERP